MADKMAAARYCGHSNLVIYLSSSNFHIRDMFHVYLNKFEFHFLRLHINKTNTFCFFMHNGCVPGIAK